MLRTQCLGRNLLGAVLLLYFVNCHLMKEASAVSSNARDFTDLLTMEWSDVDVQILKEMMDKHLSHFRQELLKSSSVSPNHHQHVKRQTNRSANLFRLPTVKGMNRLNPTSQSLNISSNLSSELTCFTWNEDHYCFLGSSIFAIRDGKAEHFLSGLPVEDNNHIRAYVYDDVVFIAVFNKLTATLRLYLLRSPGWMELVSIQQIHGQKLEDCVFFEYDGGFFMALAIQLGTKQFAQDLGMQCVIYEWLGTTMDMIDAFPAPNLNKVAVLQDDGTFLVHIHGDSSLQLWRFTGGDKNAELLEMTDVNLPSINQVEAFTTRSASRSFLLLAGQNVTFIYHLKEKRLVFWQKFVHDSVTNSVVSWTPIQQDQVDGFDSILLIFNAFQDNSPFEFYRSDVTGRFTHTFSLSGTWFNDHPIGLLSFMNKVDSVHLYAVSNSVSTEDVILDSFLIEIEDELVEDPEPDPLLQCLSDVDQLVGKLTASSTDLAEDMRDNLVHVTDDFSTSGTIFVSQMEYTQPENVSVGTIKVLYNFTEEFLKPGELNQAILELKQSAVKLEETLPNLLFRNNSTFKGQLAFTENVTADAVRLPLLSVDTLNDQEWDGFVQQALSYSSPNQIIDHDILIETVVAGNVTVGSNIGGSEPSRWLLRTGGLVTGQVSFDDVEVGGSADFVTVNGVNMVDVLTANISLWAVKGVKHFAGIQVQDNVTADLVNNVDFRDWAESLILKESEVDQHLTGFVKIEGPVEVTGDFESDSVNGVDVSGLAESLVHKDSHHQVVYGSITFTQSVQIVDAEVDSINGALIEDLLSTSGDQEIRATLNVDVVHIQGDLQCPQINGFDIGDFLYTDEDNVVLGRLQFTTDTKVEQLVIENGTVNGLDVLHLLNPVHLRIDSSVAVSGNVKVVGDVHLVKELNGMDLRDLQNQFWTKSTDQLIPVDVRMPFQVYARENITTRTFLNRSLTKEFYLTGADEVIGNYVLFFTHVNVLNDLTVEQLNPIDGVDLQALDEDVVKTEGDFQVLGTKTFEQLTIRGNVTLDDTFNELRVPDDIALLDRPQTISNIDFGSSVKAVGDVTSTGGNLVLNTVADVVLDDFMAAAVTTDQDAAIRGGLELKRHLHVNDFTVEHLLNGRNITNVVKNGLLKNSTDSLNLSNVTVYGNVTFQNTLDVPIINGYGVDEYLDEVVDMENPRTISGLKYAAGVLNVTQNVTLELLNGESLNFSALLTVSSNQTVTGDFDIERLNASYIQVNSINGQNLSDYIRAAGTDEIQIVNGEVEMENVDIRGSLSVENHVLNGCNLTRYLDVTEFDQFDSLVIADGSLTLEQPYDNNADIAALINESVRRGENQTITGTVNIESDALIENLYVSPESYGAIDLQQLLYGSMLKSVDQDISGDVNYVNGMTVESVEHAGHVQMEEWDGRDAHNLVDQVVLKTGPQTVNATKTFHGDLIVQGNLAATGNLGGVPVNTLVAVNDSLLPSGTQFTSLVIQKELNVTSGLIDGINVTAAMEQRIPLRGNATIKSNFIFKDSIVTDHLTVKKINGLNISDLAWKTAGPGQVITGKKQLKRPLNVEGDITVSKLNGRNPEEFAAYTALKDEDVVFQHPVHFNGGLSVMEHVNLPNYNGNILAEILSNVSKDISRPEDVNPLHSSARSLFGSLQNSTARLADFEYFEQIQQIPLGFPLGTNVSLRVHHCYIPTRKMSSTSDTAAGIVIATHSSDGNSCGLKKQCRCHRSESLPTDGAGRLNTLRIPTRLKDLLEDKKQYGDRVRMFFLHDLLFVLAIEADGCFKEKVSVAVLDPVTFIMKAEALFEFEESIADMAMEVIEGDVLLALSPTYSGVRIYFFDGRVFELAQIIETGRVSAIDVISVYNKDAPASVYLAVATYGLEVMSSVWSLGPSGKFELLKDILTVGATDVAFTKSDGDVYLTIAQDPSSIEPYSNNWSQFKVPAQVLLFNPATDSFELFQQLDIERVVSLANFRINGLEPFLAASNFNGKVRIYRLIRGQGFQVAQSFKSPGVKSISTYSIRNETYLAAASDSRVLVFVARLRGFQKPVSLLP